ncbi:MAG TPA: hypothetical protein VM582_08725, partial [Candidatus Thermoplasmatota archaeon]|nr:hypothetical protein [Candidatus Thermoplasmatota archaeon]
MAKHRFLSLLTMSLLLGALLAGCASEGTDGGADAADGDGDAAGTGAGAGSRPTPRSNDGAASPSGSDASDEAARWYAYAFDTPVRAKSGGAGKIQEFTFRSTREESAGATVMDVRVEVLGVTSVPVRTTRMDMTSFESTTVETPVELQRLRHTITVVSDASSGRAAGDSATVDVYVPVDELQASAHGWFFTKMVWNDGEGEEHAWEWHVTPAMQSEVDAGRAIYLPFVEGDGSDWWGFDVMATTYGLGVFSGFATGAQEFSEESFSYGGYSHRTSRETFRIGGYTFDGWSVRTSATTAQGSGEWSFDVSPDLPVPISYRIGSTGADGSDAVYAYELRDLKLG